MVKGKVSCPVSSPFLMPVKPEILETPYKKIRGTENLELFIGIAKKKWKQLETETKMTTHSIFEVAHEKNTNFYVKKPLF